MSGYVRAMPTPARNKAPSAVMLKGLTAEDFEVIDTALEHRRATLPKGAVYSRNAYLLDLIREGARAAVEGAK
jgi:hypothetical protein